MTMRRGFTLIEMAVVVSITALTAAAVYGTTRGWVYEERKNSAEVEWARAADVALAWLARDLRESRFPLSPPPDNGYLLNPRGRDVLWRAVGGRLLRDELRLGSGVAELRLDWDGPVAAATLVFEAPTGDPPFRREYTRTVEMRTGGAP
jgi:prepilin-type N-terminal cleavage/methylation domain-containing protein